MSTINVIRQKRAVHILTDGSGDFEGRQVGFHKVICIPHLNAALAMRGPLVLFGLLPPFLELHAERYDDLRSALVKATRTMLSELRAAGALLPNDGGMDGVIAGIKDDGEPDAFFFTTTDAHGVEPWSTIDLSECSLLPMTAEAHAAFNAKYPAGTTADDLDPVRDGIAIMNIQRELNTGVPPGKFAQLTTVTQENITTRVIHRW